MQKLVGKPGLLFSYLNIDAFSGVTKAKQSMMYQPNRHYHISLCGSLQPSRSQTLEFPCDVEKSRKW